VTEQCPDICSRPFSQHRVADNQFARIAVYCLDRLQRPADLVVNASDLQRIPLDVGQNGIRSPLTLVRSSGSSSASVTWAVHDPLYFVDSNSIEFCDLLPRHPVARQGADTTVLGSRYLAGLMPDRRPSPYLLLIGWYFDLRCTRRHLRQDSEDTWLAS